MNPKIWGPYMWFILHLITFNYPKNPSNYDKQAYRDFFNSLKDVIPCQSCRKHYAKNIQNYPITPNLDSKKRLVEWLIQIHNQVNMSLNKPVLTTKQVLEIYQTINPISPFIMYDQEKVSENIKNTYIKKKDVNNKILYILIFTLLIIIIFIKIHYKRNYYNY